MTISVQFVPPLRFPPLYVSFGAAHIINPSSYRSTHTLAPQVIVSLQPCCAWFIFIVCITTRFTIFMDTVTHLFVLLVLCLLFTIVKYSNSWVQVPFPTYSVLSYHLVANYYHPSHKPIPTYYNIYRQKRSSLQAFMQSLKCSIPTAFRTQSMNPKFTSNQHYYASAIKCLTVFQHQ